MKFRSTVLVTSLAIAALGLTAQASAAGCTYPKAPDNIPDGSTASKDEMIAGMKAMRAYNDQIKQYTDCLKSEHDAQVAKLDPNLPPDKKTAQTAELDKVLAQKNDAAVDEAQTVTGRFNDQIKAYNAKHKS
jgi:predicted outer membrane protein